MNRFLTWLRWIAVAGAVLLLLAIVGALIYTQTDGFRRLVEEKALAAVNQSINGVISWDRLEGSLLGSVRVHNLRVGYRERDVFRAASAEVGYSLLPLLWGRVRITRLKAASPWLELRKDAGGEWTIVQALSSGEPSTEPSEWVFTIGGITIEDGEVIFAPETSRPEVYRLRRFNARADVEIANGLEARVRQVGAWVEAPNAPAIYAQGALTYHQAGDAESVALDQFWLQTEHSKIMVAGTVKDFDAFDTDLQIALRPLAAADVGRFVAGWPAGIDVRGDAGVHGAARDLANDFKLFAAEAEISGNLRVDAVSSDKPFSGNVALRGLEISKVIAAQDLSGVASADIKVAGSAANPDSISGTGNAMVQSAVARGIALGTIKAEGNFTRRAAEINGALQGPVAEASWRGRVAFAAEPEYRVDLSVSSFKPDRIADLDFLAPADIRLSGVVQGTGFNPATMNTRADVDLLQSNVGEIAIDGGKIAARVSEGRIDFNQVRLQGTGATLTAKGSLGIDLMRPGQLDYRLEVADLTPWLQLVDQEGAGRMQVAGNATGNLARLQTRGGMMLSSAKVAGFAVDSGKIDYDLERTEDKSLPSGDVKLAFTGVRAGVSLAQLQATMKLSATADPTIAITANARDTAGRAHRIAADVEQREQALAVRARELVLTLPDGTWRLAEPASVLREGDDYIVDRATLRNQAQSLSVSGRFSLTGSQALDASIERLSLATLFAYQPKPPELTGTLSARLQIRGSAAAPVIDATAQLANSKIAGQSYDGVQARARYQSRAVTVDAVIAQDKTHTLELDGSIPLALSWQDGWRAEPLQGMNLRARSNGLSLAFLNAFKPDEIQKISGEMALDLSLRGTLDAPQPSGTFQLRNGAVEARRWGLNIFNIGAEGSADAQRLTLAQLAARSGEEGTLGGTGVIALRDFAPESVSLSVKARRWPLTQGERYRALVNGNFKVSGPPKALRVSGAAEVIEGTIRPDLEALNRSGVPLARDPTIVVVQHRGGPPLGQTEPSGQSAEENGTMLQQLAVDVSVTIPNNFWVRHPNANVELKGKLNITKKAETDLSVTGLVEVVRGWVGLQGRRFTLTEGTIRFTGGKPNDAAVNVTAEYRVNNYVVNAIVTGTADKPSLALKSEPQLEQSDILSLLLFGKPVNELTTGQQVSLQQRAIDVGAGFAAATLGKAVSEALGLQALGLDLSDISFSGGQVRFSRYVGGQTYVSVSQEVAGEHGSEVSVEYQFAPAWRLGATSASEGRSGVDIIWHKRY